MVIYDTVTQLIALNSPEQLDPGTNWSVCFIFKSKVTGTVINKQLDNFLLAALGVKLDLKDAALKQIATRRKNELLPSVTK